MLCRHAGGGGGGRDTAGLDHDKAPVQGVRAARVRWVCTLYTQLSLDSMHHSESLFETLFMSTVHEVFKKKNK